MGSEIIIVFSLLLNAIMILIVLYLVYKSDKILTQFDPVVKEGEKMRQTITKKTNEILSRTINLAQELVRSSVTQSQENLKISEDFKIEIEEMLKEGMKQIMDEAKQMIQTETNSIMTGYKSQFSSLNDEVIETAAEVKKEIIEDSRVKIDQLGKSLEETLTQIPKMIEGKVGEQLNQNEKIIAEYKAQKIKEIDEGIYKIINDVARKSIAASIDISKHEELVRVALEKAKKENLF